MKVQVKYVRDEARTPVYSTLGAAGCDIYAVEDFTVPAMTVEADLPEIHEDKTTQMATLAEVHQYLQQIQYHAQAGVVHVPSGIAVGIPIGSNIEMELRGRSGLAFKHSIFSFNGTVDEDYTDEIHIKLLNFTSKPMTFKKGERVCQAIFKEVTQVEFEVVEEINQEVMENENRYNNSSIAQTERKGGLGHTGK